MMRLCRIGNHLLDRGGVSEINQIDKPIIGFLEGSNAAIIFTDLCDTTTCRIEKKYARFGARSTLAM